MNLRDWLSNNSEVMNVMKEIPLDDRCSRENMTVLGLNWSIQNDILTINSQLKDDLMISKRTVLQEIASIYDSLGLYSPVTLRGKLFLQDLWNQKLSWDDHLSEENKSAWNVIKADLKQLATSQFPRYIGLEKTDKSYNQILVFCDSSKNAYAAAVYLLQNNEKHRTVNLVFSKTRPVPNKQITTPRLELLADLIGAWCLKFVEKELKLEISQKHMWIDSQCVLNWTNSQKPLRIFVKNRVKEIKEDKSIQYHYISTKENSEDIACRGKSTSELQGDSLWWNGPDWLVKPNTSWPEWNYETSSAQKEVITTQTESEFKRTKVMYEAKLVASEGPTDIDSPFSIDINRYSSLTKLWRITALVIRFIRKLRKESDLTGPLEATEIINAENTWTTYIQKTMYRDVIDSIQENKHHNLVSQLGLYLDKNGHIRCRGRLKHADICEGAKHPVLLPKDHRYTTLVIQMYHEKAFHTGCSQTLSLLRHKFWIPQGRSAVRRVLERCVL